MKKIGIVTYTNVHNHGAVLQALGLKKVLESLDNNVRVFHFSFERDYRYIDSSSRGKYKIGFKSLVFYFKYFFKKGPLFFLFHFIKQKKLNSFLKKHFVFNSIKKPDTDVVIIGSDEVFSLSVGFNNFMFGEGFSDDTILCSYAASFGSTTIGDIKKKEMDSTIKNDLSKFRIITVRDLNSYQIIKSLSPSLCPKLVCDPVFLYGFELEKALFKPKTSKKYVLLYSYDKNMNEDSEVLKIKEFAKNNGLEVYSVGFYHSWAKRNINCDPIELLGWFKNASFIITDTFHGTVLSLICGVEFAVKLRDNSNKLKYLLEEYNTQDRLIDQNFSNLRSIFETKIDFDRIKSTISSKREESMKHVVEMLK